MGSFLPKKAKKEKKRERIIESLEMMDGIQMISLSAIIHVAEVH
jgi:hypothetical protein